MHEVLCSNFSFSCFFVVFLAQLSLSAVLNQSQCSRRRQSWHRRRRKMLTFSKRLQGNLLGGKEFAGKPNIHI